MYERKLILLILVLLCVIVMGCGGSKSPEITNILVSGLVDSTDGTRIQGAKITVTPIDSAEVKAAVTEATSDETGRYRLVLFPYIYNIKVVCEGYGELELSNKALIINMDSLDFKLDPLAVIVIRVYDDDDTTIVTYKSNIRITNNDTQEAATDVKWSDDKRDYLAIVSPGKYSIRVSCEEKTAREENIDIEGGGRFPVRLKLVKPASGQTTRSKLDDKSGGSVDTPTHGK